MEYVKSDKVKQSISGLEKFHPFTENKLKLLFCKEFDQCDKLLRKIILEGEMYHLLRQLPLTVEERNNFFTYSRSFFPSVIQSWSGLHRMLTDFWYLLDWFHSWFLHFSWTEHSLFGNYKSKQTLCIHQFILESLREGYIRDSINRMNNGQAKH